LKRVLIATVVALIATQSFAAGWNKSLADATRKAKTGNRLIFVDMFADWCGWCHKMEQEVFPSEMFQKATDDMVLLRLNTEDGADGTKLAQKFYVTSLPTFLVLTSDGGVAGMIRGYAPAKEFVDQLKATETKYRDFQKQAANESAFATDYQKRFELAHEFTTHFQLAESEVRFRKLTADPGTPQPIRDKAYLELATAQVLQERLADASQTINAFSKVESKGESFERARMMQAQIYWQQGNLQAALNEFRAFKQRFPSSVLIPNADQSIAQLEHLVSKK
jgi:thioredoxin-related protein